MSFYPQLIAALLSDHTPADALEVEHVRRFQSLLMRSTPPWPNDRGLLPPVGPGHLTASVFVVCMTESGRAVLLLEHPKLLRMLQPGGHLEPGESDPRQAASRELIEETGLSFEPERFALIDFDIHTIPANPRKSEPQHEHFDIRYAIFVPDGVPTPSVAPADPAPLHWLTPDRLRQLPADAGLARVFRKLSLT